jgi:hypothetical protein
MPARPTRGVAASVPVVRAIRLPAVESKAAAGVPGVPHPRMRAAIAVPETGRTPDRLPHRELRRGPRRRLSFRSGQSRPDQLTVDRTLLFLLGALGFFFGLHRALDRFGRLLWLGPQPWTGRRLGLDRTLARTLRVACRPRWAWPGHPGQDLLVQRPRGVLLLPLGREPCMTVIVLGVACRAAGLPDLLLDHRHHGVVRNPALARTIVVENVTEP